MCCTYSDKVTNQSKLHAVERFDFVYSDSCIDFFLHFNELLNVNSLHFLSTSSSKSGPHCMTLTSFDTFLVLFLLLSLPSLHKCLDSTQHSVDVCLQLSSELSTEGRLVICLTTRGGETVETWYFFQFHIYTFL